MINENTQNSFKKKSEKVFFLRNCLSQRKAALQRTKNSNY